MKRFSSISPIFSLLAILLSVGLLMGCNGEQTPAAEASQTSGEPVIAVESGGGQSAAAAPQAPVAATVSPTATPEPLSGRIVLWHSWAGSEGDALAQILEKFKQEQPGVTVDTLYVAYPDLAQGYADAVSGAGGPDLVLAPTWWLTDFVSVGVVQPLDELVTPNEIAQYYPATVDNLRWQGKLYGLPTNYELVSLFVNRALADPASAPATTDALLAQAQVTTTQGIGLYNSLYHLFWGIPAYGGQLFDDQGAAILDQTGNTVGYLQWLKDISRAPGSYVDTDYGMLLDRFKKGEFAYFVDGPWAIGELRAALGDNLAVTKLPAGPAGPAQPWLNADGVMLNPRITPEQQKLALAFARSLTSAEGGSILAETAKRLPANQQAALGTDPVLKGFMDQAATALPLPATSEMQEVWGYGGDLLIKVVDGDADPTTAVKETTALINEANGK